MTMLDHDADDADDEIGESDDDNDGDDVEQFHCGKHKPERNSKNKNRRFRQVIASCRSKRLKNEFNFDFGAIHLVVNGHWPRDPKRRIHHHCHMSLLLYYSV